MKIFTNTNTKSWESKVNFVDANNVFVGYDMTQQCCEGADWFISDTIHSSLPLEIPKLTESDVVELESFSFDISFLHQDELDILNPNVDDGVRCDAVIFKLVNINNVEKYLHIVNTHNGWYFHGFSMTKDDNILHTGKI